MQEVVLIIHLILALTIIVLVLLQRSAGGGLGIGGSGGLGDFATARGAASALTKATTICAFLFFATSLSLAVLAGNRTDRGGLLENYQPANEAAPVLPSAPDITTEEPAESAPVQPPEPPVSTE